MKKSDWLIITLVSFSLLLAGDLATQFWFWSNLHLVFDAGNFNNIVTPVAGIVTFIAVAIALYFSYRQNQITLSQHIIQHYDRKIDRLRDELKNTYVMLDPLIVHDAEANKKMTAFNYTAVIGEILQVWYHKDMEYRQDLKDYRSGTRHTIDYYENRSYYTTVLNLYPYFTGQALNFLNYQKIKSLLVEIQSSQLIEIDKAHLAFTIKTEFVGNYVSFVEFLEKYPRAVPLMPNLFSPTDDQHPIEWTPFVEGGFKNYYDDFRIENSSTPK